MSQLEHALEVHLVAWPLARRVHIVRPERRRRVARENPPRRIGEPVGAREARIEKERRPVPHGYLEVLERASERHVTA
eukprot:4588997-Prymnesium_polylepis.2